MRLRTAAMGLFVGSLVSICACTTSTSNQSTAASAQLFPVVPGASVTGFDQGFCNLDRQRGQRCGQLSGESHGGWRGSSSAAEAHNTCLENSCKLRVTHGVDLATQIDNCMLSRPCGESSREACQTMVLGVRASTPQAQQAFARCNPFEQKCSTLTATEGKSVNCGLVATMGPELLAAINPCFDLACGLGQQCIAGHFTRALVGCDLPDPR